MAGCDQAAARPCMYWQPYGPSMQEPFMQSVLTDEQYPGTSPWQECNTAENLTQKKQKYGASQHRKRTIFSKPQLNILQLFFQTNQYPDIQHREELAKCLNIPKSRVQVWFQNRRVKAKRESGNLKKGPVLIDYFPDDQTGCKVLHQRDLLRQQKVAATAKRVKELKPSKPNFFHQPPSMGYHPYSYQVPQVQHVASKAFCQNVANGTNMGVHQHVYKNVATVMGNEAMDLNGGFSHITNLFDYNQFPPNKTTTSDISVGASVSSVTKNLNSYNGLKPFSTPVPYQMSIAHSSTPSDSGFSEWSTDSDWEDLFSFGQPSTLLQSELGDEVLAP